MKLIIWQPVYSRNATYCVALLWVFVRGFFLKRVSYRIETKNHIVSLTTAFDL